MCFVEMRWGVVGGDRCWASWVCETSHSRGSRVGQSRYGGCSYSCFDLSEEKREIGIASDCRMVCDVSKQMHFEAEEQ